MSLFLILLVIVMGMGVGWTIGANDAANSLGPAVGSKILTLKQAVILIAIFGFLGAFLQGSHVVKTIGKGIVPLNLLDKSVALKIALVACFATSAWVILATYWKMPISTSHSIVGAVAGAGVALGVPVKWKVFGDIFICWIFTPIGAAILGCLFYIIFKNMLYRFLPRRHLKRTMAVLTVLSGCYVAYSWGANDVANATGIIAGAGVLTSQLSVIVGGVAIVIGILTWGYKVIETIGSNIAYLLPIMAFSAQLASAINVHIYSICGIPVSTSHSIVGAIFGVCMVRGVRVINIRIMREIIICWLATPFITGIISFLVCKGIVFVKL